MYVLYMLCLSSFWSQRPFQLCVQQTEVKPREKKAIIAHPCVKLLFAHFSSRLMWFSHSPEISYRLNHSQQAAFSIPLLLSHGDICSAHR